MTETKFTEGEWWVNHIGPHHSNPAISQHEICFNKEEECIVDHVYRLADAHLIAAAPEMYELLEFFAKMAMPTAGELYEKCDEAVKLLAKARGER